jgi:hypothetical protein
VRAWDWRTKSGAFSGYVDIKEAREYTFQATSDDGSKLFIDGTSFPFALRKIWILVRLPRFVTLLHNVSGKSGMGVRNTPEFAPST